MICGSCIYFGECPFPVNAVECPFFEMIEFPEDED